MGFFGIIGKELLTKFDDLAYRWVLARKGLRINDIRKQHQILSKLLHTVKLRSSTHTSLELKLQMANQGRAAHHQNLAGDVQIQDNMRSFRHQSTAYVDRPDIPIPCSALGQRSYLRDMQSSLSQDNKAITKSSPQRYGPIIRLRKASESFASESLNLEADSASDKLPRGSKNALDPFSKSPQPQLEQTPSPRSNNQPSALQLALFGSFSSVPRRRKKVSPSSMPSSMPMTQKKQRRRRETVTENHDVILRLSLPCRAGCCYCVYASLLGPVRISFSRGDTPTKGRYLAGIRDGHGRAVIPSSRKADIRGLVYDPESHSLHPPALGERPFFRVSNRGKADRDRLDVSILSGRRDGKRK
ncbi:hypothetical protein PoB_006862200 [Plakobranchus ocellatus]|uniref:Uncharacterized protein n=1 Tax=Plakobranchus ocellatus TaxID=259542 RepID=A0AAV4DCZ5_9GAST|nr:hypothetical protein PoB_006862200 [Plakobranchus ocellatus]